MTAHSFSHGFFFVVSDSQKMQNMKRGSRGDGNCIFGSAKLRGNYCSFLFENKVPQVLIYFEEDCINCSALIVFTSNRCLRLSH